MSIVTHIRISIYNYIAKWAFVYRHHDKWSCSRFGVVIKTKNSNRQDQQQQRFAVEGDGNMNNKRERDLFIPFT